MTEQNQTPAKKVKVKGPIRWEAIIPFTIVCLIIGLYFHFFFDTHLRKGMEWAGYKAIGAEVNIGKLETSFFKASLNIEDIEITDAEKPTHDSLKIGDIRFSMLWDALLRAKVVINEAAVEQIEFGVKRKYPGKVAPPEPPSNEPGFADKQAAKLKENVLNQAESQFGDNVLTDVIAMLGGTDAQAQLDKLAQTLPSKAMLEKFDAELKGQQKKWDEKIKTLPQAKDIQALGDRLNKIKYKDFKNVQELQASLQELDKVVKEGDAKYKQVQSVATELQTDLKGLETQYKAIDTQIKTDIKTLETHFRIPKLDAKALTMAVFQRYLAPYRAKFNRYKALAEKYLPPNLVHKKTQDPDDIPIQPHPREVGVTYEFGRPNSYPLFWIKRTGVSSQAGLSPNSGNIKGEILDITSNQKLIGKPTVASIAGDFPANQIAGVLLKLVLDNRKPDSVIDYLLKVGAYPLEGKDLVQSDEVKIAFQKAVGSLDINGKLVGLKDLTLNFNNRFSQIDYAINAKNNIADEILKAVFAGIPLVTLDVTGSGTLPGIDLSVNSNLGLELQKGFEKQIQAKIDEAKKKVQAYIDQEIGKLKAQVDGEMNKLKGQIDTEVKKAQAQLDGQKKQAEDKIKLAQKDAENQGKKKLEEEGKKAVDELKKKLGF
ncbi:TIGR03545 family protein [Bdellovibrio sp. HCB2-146]|uniref:TIGR03545 family protein n=1 Tax=Bdellovibrio sp. HCB2-146 TaxID=3394362 RepID=UPI0039BCBE78